ncbi:MAG: hypothetical protein ONA90_10025 [candidate division KSB1 bacterium]|nr:hypothetical protein [candidate division KSB1 bacterium]
MWLPKNGIDRNVGQVVRDGDVFELEVLAQKAKAGKNKARTARHEKQRCWNENIVRSSGANAKPVEVRKTP